jgi:hypothetical protein
MRRRLSLGTLALALLAFLAACVSGGATPTPVNHATPVAEVTISANDAVANSCANKDILPRTTQPGQGRETTGPCTAKRFVTGEMVIGGKISFEINHLIISFDNCFLASAPIDGYVSNGVISPLSWEVRVANFPPCPIGSISTV